ADRGPAHRAFVRVDAAARDGGALVAEPAGAVPARQTAGAGAPRDAASHADRPGDHARERRPDLHRRGGSVLCGLLVPVEDAAAARGGDVPTHDLPARLAPRGAAA